MENAIKGRTEEGRKKRKIKLKGQEDTKGFKDGITMKTFKRTNGGGSAIQKREGDSSEQQEDVIGSLEKKGEGSRRDEKERSSRRTRMLGRTSWAIAWFHAR